DPKPEAPAEIRGKYKPIPTALPGLYVGEHLPRMARVMDRLTLVRSGAHNNDHHETATNWVLCGRFGTPFGGYPAMGAVVEQQRASGRTLRPYAAAPPSGSFPWDRARSPFPAGRSESYKPGDPNPAGSRVQSVSRSEPLAARRAARRQTLLAAVDSLAKRVEG